MGSSTQLTSTENNQTASVVKRLLANLTTDTIMESSFNADSNTRPGTVDSVGDTGAFNKSRAPNNTGSGSATRMRSKASTVSLGFNEGESAVVDTLNNNSPETAKTVCHI